MSWAISTKSESSSLGPIEPIDDSSDDSLGVKDISDMGGGGEWGGRGECGTNVIIMNV